MSVFHNPALLAFSRTSQAAFAYNDWLLDLSMQSGALLFSYSKLSVGLSFSVFTTPDIELRILPSDEPIETFSAHDMAAGLSVAYRYGDDLALGLTTRYLHQQIYTEEASGLGFDLGAAWHLRRPRITLAGSLRNLGKMGPLQSESSPLPTAMVLGAEGVIARKDDFGLRGMTDAQYLIDDNLRFHAGLEGSWKDHFFLRAGYQTGSDLRTFSGGAGLSWDRYRFNYAYQPLAEDFDASHRFDFSFTF